MIGCWLWQKPQAQTPRGGSALPSRCPCFRKRLCDHCSLCIALAEHFVVSSAMLPEQQRRPSLSSPAAPAHPPGRSRALSWPASLLQVCEQHDSLLLVCPCASAS